MNDIPQLRIGDIELELPIIQGGMGVRVSGASLAAAAANNGCMGVISCAGLGDFESQKSLTLAHQVALDAIASEIKLAKSQTSGPIGVNIMCALSQYPIVVEKSLEAGCDIIISGAGLPVDLPSLVRKDTKIIPIVSSLRTLKLLCRRWEKRYSRLPDAVIIEGVKAGGHLGFKYEEVIDGTAQTLESITAEILEFAKSAGWDIPIIAAGGIFYGQDICKFLDMGAAGVQMGTRFVTTDECDVHHDFKQAYLDCTEEDLVIIKSPVGLPGRVLKNDFVDKITQGANIPFVCRYKCLHTCDPKTSPYCIAKTLSNAANGEGEYFCFAGSNAHLCNEIIPVKELVEKIVHEMEEYRKG